MGIFTTAALRRLAAPAAGSLALLSAGAAFAQSTYDFSFGVLGSATTGRGSVTLAADLKVLSVSNFRIDNTVLTLFTSGFTGNTQVGTNPHFDTLYGPPFMNNATSRRDFVLTDGVGHIYDFSNTSGSADSVKIYDGSTGSVTSVLNLTNEQLVATPAPTPGGGWVSWTIAALGLLGVGLRMQMRTVSKAELTPA